AFKKRALSDTRRNGRRGQGPPRFPASLVGHDPRYAGFSATLRMAVTIEPSGAQRPSLSATLRNVHVAMREELEVTRHVFRGVPSYIVRDPVTFQSQRLAVA